MSFHVEGHRRMRIDMFYCENDSDSVSVLVAAQACAWVLAWHMHGISWLVHGASCTALRVQYSAFWRAVVPEKLSTSPLKSTGSSCASRIACLVPLRRVPRVGADYSVDGERLDWHAPEVHVSRNTSAWSAEVVCNCYSCCFPSLGESFRGREQVHS